MPIQLSGSLVITGSITTTGGITISGSILSASYAATSSFSNDFTVLGNLTVFGTQSIQYITSSQLNVSDNVITVNVASPGVRFGGLSVFDSGSLSSEATASLFWDSQNNHWIYQRESGSTYNGGMLISGPRNFAGLGNEQGTTSGSLMKGQGGDHITSSAIFEDGYKATFYGTSFMISSSGNVGIGTTTNTTNGITELTIGSANTNPLINGIRDGLQAFALSSDSVGTLLNERRNLDLRFSSNNTEKMRVTSVGLVGIGVTNPTGSLSLKAQVTNTPTLVFQNVSGGPHSAISNYTSAIQTFTVIGANMYVDSTANIARFNTSYEGSGITFDEGILRFSTGTSGMTPTARMTILNSGNVGIGTGTPNGPLDIVGTLYGGLYTLSLYDSAAVAANIGGGIYFGGNYTGTTKTGWAGILGRKDNATDGEYGGYMAFQTRTHGSAPAERMRITSAGYVGIGTTTSVYAAYSKLIVAGGIAYNNNTDDEVPDNAYGQSFAKKINIVAGSGANTIYGAAGSEGALHVITGLNTTTSARFVDLVLWLGAASTAPTVISSQTYLSPGTRTYANSGENLTLSITGNSNTYTIRMTGMGCNERA